MVFTEFFIDNALLALPPKTPFSYSPYLDSLLITVRGILSELTA